MAGQWRVRRGRRAEGGRPWPRDCACAAISGPRFGAQEPEEKEFFLGLARHEETKGPVSLSIYPDKEDVVRAAAALQAGDADLFSSLEAGAESAMPCRTLKRLARQPR
ncbi:hypothetical protein [Streptomyces sp. NPDC055134]